MSVMISTVRCEFGQSRLSMLEVAHRRGSHQIIEMKSESLFMNSLFDDEVKSK